MIAFEVARDKLLQFETADEIAAFLKSEGVKAMRAMSTSCAIADWMTTTTGEAVYVNHSEMWRNSWSNGTIALHAHNPALGEFIQRFDHGYYPELIKDPDDARICRLGKERGLEPPCYSPMEEFT